jgi:hypothetical protein
MSNLSKAPWAPEAYTNGESLRKAMDYDDRMSSGVEPPPPPGSPPPAVATRSAETAGGVLPSNAAGAGFMTATEASSVNECLMCPNCGFYASAALWRHAFVQGNTEAGYCCHLEWACFKAAFPQHYAEVMRVCGSEERADCLIGFGCHFTYKVAFPMTILEVKELASSGGGCGCMIAEKQLPAIVDILSKFRVSFCATLDNMTETEVASTWYPITKLNPWPLALANLANIPGIGKLSLQGYFFLLALQGKDHPRAGGPGWWRLLRAVAGCNLTALQPVYDQATATLSALGQPLECSRELEEQWRTSHPW